MKTTRLTKGQITVATFLCGIGAALALTFALAGLAGAAESQKDGGGGILAPLKQWQEKMSEAFRDSFKGLGDGQGAKPLSSVSADLREQNDTYTLRLNLPNRSLDKVEVDLEGNRIHIVAPEEGTAKRYEQTIALADLPPEPKIQVERRQTDGLIMVTIPKTAAPAPASPKAPERPLDELGPVFRRDRDIMESMERMQRDMDRIFEESFKSFKLLPGYTGWFDQYRFSSTYEIKDEGADYVVRAYLPNRDMQNVSVEVVGQVLHIDARAEDSGSQPKGKEEKETTVHRARYTQSVTLPGPVNAVKMKVERKENMLVVTLPKAS